MKMLQRKQYWLLWNELSVASLLYRHMTDTGLAIIAVLCSFCQAWYLPQLEHLGDYSNFGDPHHWIIWLPSFFSIYILCAICFAFFVYKKVTNYIIVIDFHLDYNVVCDWNVECCFIFGTPKGDVSVPL